MMFLSFPFFGHLPTTKTPQKSAKNVMRKNVSPYHLRVDMIPCLSYFNTVSKIDLFKVSPHLKNPLQKGIESEHTETRDGGNKNIVSEWIKTFSLR